MFRVVNKIQIGKYSFTGCISVNITKSRDQFTQTAIIKMPNVFYRQTGNPVFISDDLTALIKRGDNIKIWNGYNKTFDEISLKFMGFVTRVQADDTITIYCEDYAYALKQVNVPSKSFANATITDIVEYALHGINIDVEYDDPDFLIGDWVIDNNSNVNSIQVLEKLDDFGVRVYFKDNVLRIGGFTDIETTTNCFIFEHNIISDDLAYNDAQEVNLVLKGISNLETNEKIERYAYLMNNEVQISEDAINGEQRTLNYYNITASQLEDNLRNNFSKYIYTGYSGSFQTFLEPFVDVNNFVNLYSIKYPEKNSQYKVKGVMIDIDINGAFQRIELDYKIKSL